MRRACTWRRMPGTIPRERPLPEAPLPRQRAGRDMTCPRRQGILHAIVKLKTTVNPKKRLFCCLLRQRGAGKHEDGKRMGEKGTETGKGAEDFPHLCLQNPREGKACAFPGMVLRRSRGGTERKSRAPEKTCFLFGTFLPVRGFFFAGTGLPCRNRLPARAGNACPGVPEGENCNLRACRKTQGEAQAKAEGKKRGQRAGRRRMGRAFASGLALFCIKVRETLGRRSRRPFFRKGMEQRRGKGQRIFRISACKTHGRAKRAPSRAWCCAGAGGGQSVKAVLRKKHASCSVPFCRSEAFFLPERGSRAGTACLRGPGTHAPACLREKTATCGPAGKRREKHRQKRRGRSGDSVPGGEGWEGLLRLAWHFSASKSGKLLGAEAGGRPDGGEKGRKNGKKRRAGRKKNGEK